MDEAVGNGGHQGHLDQVPVWELNGVFREAGFNVINECIIEFPSSGNQVKFREKMARLLKPYYVDQDELDEELEREEAASKAEDRTEVENAPPVKMLLDEHYSGLKHYLENLGWDVVTVYEVGLDGTRSHELVDYANNNGLLLVTKEKKLEDLAVSDRALCVLLTSQEVAAFIDWLFKEKYRED
jgi:predicted nuclease of predicted toxin-antitoxin system